MLDSLILLKLAALGCFGIIFIAIASFLRWIEEESYNNEDGLQTSTDMISSDNKKNKLLPMYLSSTPSFSLEMQKPGSEEDVHTNSVKSGLDEPDTQNCPFQLTDKDCNQLTNLTGLTTTEDTDLYEKSHEETCKESPNAFHGTCTILSEPGSKTEPGLVTMKRFHVVHTSAKQTPPVDEIINLVQQCLSLHGCKGNIRCHTGISGDLIIGISLKVPDDKRNSTPI